MNDEAVCRTAPATPGLLMTWLVNTTFFEICQFDHRNQLTALRSRAHLCFNTTKKRANDSTRIIQ